MTNNILFDPRFSFDQTVSFYDETRRVPEWVSQSITETLLDAIHPSNSSNFLEIGIGTGRVAIPFVRKGYLFSGIDTSRAMLNCIDKSVREMSNLNLAVGDATWLPYMDNSFDVIIAVHVLHLVPDWKYALREIKRTLKPTGTFCYVARHWRATSSLNSVIRKKFRELASQIGVTIRKMGVNSDDELEKELHQMGAIFNKTHKIEWTNSITVKQVMERLGNNVYEDTWQLTDIQKQTILLQLQDWINTTFDDPNNSEEQQNAFCWTLVNFPEGEGATNNETKKKYI